MPGNWSLMALNNQTGNATAGNISGYISLPNGIISSKTNLTLEIWARTIINPPVSERLFDFGNANHHQRPRRGPRANH